MKLGWLLAAGAAALAIVGLKKNESSATQPVDVSGGIIDQNTSLAASQPNPLNIANVPGIMSSNSAGVVKSRTERYARAIENLQQAYAGGGGSIIGHERTLAALQSGSHRNYAHIEASRQQAYQAALGKIIENRPDSAKAVLAKQQKKPAGLGGANLNSVR